MSAMMKNKSDKSFKGDNSEKKTVNAEKKSGLTKRCFNCGLKDHVSTNCPSKEKGAKCFKCSEHGHIASNCPKEQKPAASSYAITHPTQSKQPKDVLINVPVKAIIDTGSDITIMRADEFIKIGSPYFVHNQMSFRGIGKEQGTTIGEFRAKLTVDENSYAITIHVVSAELSRYGLLIGRDFLDTVELNVKRKNVAENACRIFESHNRRRTY